MGDFNPLPGIDAEQLDRDLRDLAERYPSRTCGSTYVQEVAGGTTLTPCCIVGHALVRQEVSIATLLEVEGRGVHSIVPSSSRFALEVQGNQDNGADWGDAVKRADRAVSMAGYW